MTGINPVQVSNQQEHLDKFLRPHLSENPTKITRVTNYIADIDGARPRYKSTEFTKNRPWLHDPQDIPGTKSNRLHPINRNVGQDERFQQLPVEGSRPRQSGFHTKRTCNPLAPEYKLPTFVRAAEPPPKFLRDSYNVSDIEGTSKKPTIIDQPRDILKLDDIPGAHAGWRPRHRRESLEHPPRDIINVQDITDPGFRSTRVTNVLNPVYEVNGMTYQDDELSHPSALHPPKNKVSYVLETADIKGANSTDPKDRVVARIPNVLRRHYIHTNKTEDIPGAQANTTQRTLRSERRVDPTFPDYIALDGQHADMHEMCLGRNVVYASKAQEQESIIAAYRQRHQLDVPLPYVTAGISNIGQLPPFRPGQKWVPPRPAQSTPKSSRTSGSSKATPMQKQQDKRRQEEIALVKSLS